MSTLVPDRPGQRWSISLALVLGLHGAVVAGWAWWHAARPPEPLPLPADAVKVDMAPLPSAPPTPPTDLPPGPPQQEQHAAAPKAGKRPQPKPLPAPSPRPAEVALPRPVLDESASERSAPGATDVARTTAPPRVQAPEGRRYAADQPLSGDSPRVMVTWQAQVLGRLQEFKRYPRVARRRLQEGVVLVRYRVDRAGNVLAVDLVQGSGHPVLDEEAMAAVRRASPLPPPPPEIPGDPVEVATPVDFSLRDR